MKKLLISIGSFYNDYIIDNNPILIGYGQAYTSTQECQDSRLICDLERNFDVTLIKPEQSKSVRDMMLYKKVLYCKDSLDYHETLKKQIKKVDAAILMANEPGLVPTKIVTQKTVQFEKAEQAWETIATESKPVAIKINNRQALNSIPAIEEARIFFTVEEKNAKSSEVFFRSKYGDFVKKAETDSREILTTFFVQTFKTYADPITVETRPKITGLSFAESDLTHLEKLFSKWKDAIFVACRQRNDSFLFMTRTDPPKQVFYHKEGVLSCSDVLSHQHMLACLATAFACNQDATFAVYQQSLKTGDYKMPFVLATSKKAIEDARWRFYKTSYIEGYGQLLVLNSQKKVL